VGDAEVQDQRHRACRIRQISRKFDVPTILTPVFNHLLCFNFIRCAKKVNKLINRPVVSLFGTRVSSTGTEMIDQCVYPKLPTTTNRKDFSGITGI
jgi:hypothetical protein